MRIDQVLLLDTDWDSIVWRSGDDRRMARVLTVWEEHLVDPHLPRTLRGSLEAAGFDPNTFSARLLEIITGFVAGRGGLTKEDVEAWAADLRALGADYFFSLNRYLFHATKPA